MSTQYTVSQSGSDNVPVVSLRDGVGREVRVAPSAGFNAFSFRVPHGDGTLEVLVEPESEQELQAGGFGFGCPILFPFPNRTRGGHYTFNGQSHQLDVNWKDGHAIHGLVNDVAWAVKETGASDEHGAWVRASIDIEHHADMLRQYPFPCTLSVTYRLRDGVLGIEASVVNTGSGVLPMGFGIHPWFPCPLTQQGRREDCVLVVPARGRWKLESEEQLVPTGEVMPVEGEFDFSEGRTLGGTFLDDVFTQLKYQGGEHVTQVRDAASGLLLEVRASQNFREHVVFAPLERDVICLEPYTMTTDFVNLAAQGADSGLRVLAPGESWHGQISIACRATSLDEG